MDNFDLRKYLAEGRLFESINFNDVLSTPQEFYNFIIQQIQPGSEFDKIISIRFPKVDTILFDGEYVILNDEPYSEVHDGTTEEEWEEIKQDWFEGENPTKRIVFEDFLERLKDWRDIEYHEEYEGQYKKDYGIDEDEFYQLFDEYIEKIYDRYKQL